ncbi:hypothetical protein AC578_9788 [Pseudocercospora eumusae]|uniref:HAT C-terminal dimerisation domain-containing protein n=1 Tax=Pseudocercospora eumusae TaxID=321146 RepID=A0A139H581_9PEZI|nr:hypothetical protein AC578_9788 [Pseudocercospora eumusae]
MHRVPHRICRRIFSSSIIIIIGLRAAAEVERLEWVSVSQRSVVLVLVRIRKAIGSNLAPRNPISNRAYKLKDVFLGMNVQSVNDAWNVTQNRQEDVNEEVSAAATLEEDAEWWEEDGEDDLDDVAGGFER